jgi:hypothetical protein
MFAAVDMKQSFEVNCNYYENDPRLHHEGPR